jgi:hypothetical protein
MTELIAFPVLDESTRQNYNNFSESGLRTIQRVSATNISATRREKPQAGTQYIFNNKSRRAWI